MVPNAVVVAKLNAKECKYEGVSENENQIPGVKTLAMVKQYDADIPQQWQDLNAYWFSHLQLLAEQFKTGIATVDPINCKACEYCHLAPLCRISEGGV
jgi:hypothetical protein